MWFWTVLVLYGVYQQNKNRYFIEYVEQGPFNIFYYGHIMLSVTSVVSGGVAGSFNRILVANWFGPFAADIARYGVILWHTTKGPLLLRPQPDEGSSLTCVVGGLPTQTSARRGDQSHVCRGRPSYSHLRQTRGAVSRVSWEAFLLTPQSDERSSLTCVVGGLPTQTSARRGDQSPVCRGRPSYSDLRQTRGPVSRVSWEAFLLRPRPDEGTSLTCVVGGLPTHTSARRGDQSHVCRGRPSYSDLSQTRGPVSRVSWEAFLLRPPPDEGTSLTCVVGGLPTQTSARRGDQSHVCRGRPSYSHLRQTRGAVSRVSWEAFLLRPQPDEGTSLTWVVGGLPTHTSARRGEQSHVCRGRPSYSHLRQTRGPVSRVSWEAFLLRPQSDERTSLTCVVRGLPTQTSARREDQSHVCRGRPSYSDLSQTRGPVSRVSWEAFLLRPQPDERTSLTCVVGGLPTQTSARRGDQSHVCRGRPSYSDLSQTRGAVSRVSWEAFLLRPQPDEGTSLTWVVGGLPTHTSARRGEQSHVCRGRPSYSDLSQTRGPVSRESWEAFLLTPPPDEGSSLTCVVGGLPTHTSVRREDQSHVCRGRPSYSDLGQTRGPVSRVSWEAFLLTPQSDERTSLTCVVGGLPTQTSARRREQSHVCRGRPSYSHLSQTRGPVSRVSWEAFLLRPQSDEGTSLTCVVEGLPTQTSARRRASLTCVVGGLPTHTSVRRGDQSHVCRGRPSYSDLSQTRGAVSRVSWEAFLLRPPPDEGPVSRVSWEAFLLRPQPDEGTSLTCVVGGLPTQTSARRGDQSHVCRGRPSYSDLRQTGGPVSRVSWEAFLLRPPPDEGSSLTCVVGGLPTPTSARRGEQSHVCRGRPSYSDLSQTRGAVSRVSWEAFLLRPQPDEGSSLTCVVGGLPTPTSARLGEQSHVCRGRPSYSHLSQTRGAVSRVSWEAFLLRPPPDEGPVSRVSWEAFLLTPQPDEGTSLTCVVGGLPTHTSARRGDQSHVCRGRPSYSDLSQTRGPVSRVSWEAFLLRPQPDEGTSLTCVVGGLPTQTSARRGDQSHVCRGRPSYSDLSQTRGQPMMCPWKPTGAHTTPDCNCRITCWPPVEQVPVGLPGGY